MHLVDIISSVWELCKQSWQLSNNMNDYIWHDLLNKFALQILCDDRSYVHRFIACIFPGWMRAPAWSTPATIQPLRGPHWPWTHGVCSRHRCSDCNPSPEADQGGRPRGGDGEDQGIWVNGLMAVDGWSCCLIHACLLSNGNISFFLLSWKISMKYKILVTWKHIDLLGHRPNLSGVIFLNYSSYIR